MTLVAAPTTTSSCSSNIALSELKPTEMSFVDQALSNDVFISLRGRLQQKLITRLTKRTIRPGGCRGWRPAPGRNTQAGFLQIFRTTTNFDPFWSHRLCPSAEEESRQYLGFLVYICFCGGCGKDTLYLKLLWTLLRTPTTRAASCCEEQAGPTE